MNTLAPFGTEPGAMAYFSAPPPPPSMTTRTLSPSEPRRLLETPFANIMVVASVSTLWICFFLFLYINMQYITANGYLHFGPGATEAELYPYSDAARIDALEACVLAERADRVAEREARHRHAMEGQRWLWNMSMPTTPEAFFAFQQNASQWWSRLVDNNDTAQTATATATATAACNFTRPTESAPTAVVFLGSYISDWKTYFIIQSTTFAGTVVSAYTTNTAGVYFSNVIQDSDVIDLPFNEFEVQFSGMLLWAYWQLSSVFELQISFVQYDFLLTVIAGQVVFRVLLTHWFMDEKRRKKREAMTRKEFQQLTQAMQQEEERRRLLDDQDEEGIPRGRVQSIAHPQSHRPQKGGVHSLPMGKLRHS